MRGVVGVTPRQAGWVVPDEGARRVSRWAGVSNRHLAAARTGHRAQRGLPGRSLSQPDTLASKPRGADELVVERRDHKKG